MNIEISLDHIGVAIDQEMSKFYELLGLESQGDETVPSEGVKVEFLNTANNAKIELLSPLGDESPVAKYMAKKGPGVHHICFRVKNLESLVEKLKAQGVRLINDEPRPGAHGMRVVFIHPKAAGGVLVELNEPAKV